MQKFKQKQLLQLKSQEVKISEAYRHSLDLLLQNQKIKILIEYSKKQFENIDLTKIQSINDYSPVNISRLIFAEELSQINYEISNLPNKNCPLMHFIIIMLKVIKFPFQKVPFYLLGLKQMFHEIKNDEQQDFVNFQQIKSYMLGQVVNFTDENQFDTEFQIRFTENKMQDFLMHDNGVKKMIYSNDLHKYIVLDEYSSFIKIYDDNMKMVAKFQPNKDKHNKKHHNILTFDYNQFGSKLGISQSDKTFSMIHLGNFLSTPSQDVFHSVFLNEIIYKSNGMINKIYFLSMMNKWLCIDQSNQIWIYDVQNYKQENQNYCKKFKHPNDDYQITDVIQLIGLSSIVFIVHNEIWFYNESLSNKKWKKFSHSQEIKKLIYEEERNQFYLVGKQEKSLTIFTLNKMSGDPNKIWTFETNQVIADFDVFSFHNTILILDCKNNLKVYNMDKPQLQYQKNYDFIVKKSQLSIKLVKNSKTTFLIHATYILRMQLKKVAIQRDIQFSFQEMFYYDSNKEEIVLSVNNQIMSVSIMHGQIRKNVAVQNSNIDKHKAFYMGKNTELFLVDQNDNLYQVLNKTDPKYKELKSFRKNVGINGIKKSFYDEEYRMVIMISDSSLYIVKNDANNNFTFKSCLLLENSPQFIKYKYYNKTKQLLFLDFSNTVYLMKSYNFQVQKIIQLKIFKEQNEGEKIVIDIQYEQDLKVLMILTNNGQFGVFNIQNPSKALFIKLKDFLPYQLQSNTFNHFSYQKASFHDKKSYPNRVFFYNLTGLLIEFQIQTMIHKIAPKDQIIDQCLKINYIKDTHEIDFITLKQKIKPILFKLQKSHIYQFDFKDVSFIKAHDKKIVYCQRIYLQEYNLLTIGEDGHIRLWGKNRKIYFDLKMPLMVKIQWNMNELHQKRIFKIINQTIEFLKNISQIMKKNEQKQILNIDLKKRLKNKSQKIKINHENPIQIEFENKDLQQIVFNKKQFDPQFMTIDFVKNQRKFEIKRMNVTQRISQPWKKKRQFQQLYQKASPVDKYVHKFHQKMPFDLQILRNDLHMEKEFSLKKNKNKKHQDNLIILPQLKQYLKSKQLQIVKHKSTLNPEEKKHQNIAYMTNLNQENKFKSCLFVKTQRGPKKNNAFDQIDKYFWQKQQILLNKRWIPNKRGLMKTNHTLEPKSQFIFSSTQNRKIDPLKQVIKIFEEHNKEALNGKKGRLINIPQLSGQSHQQKRKKV